MLLLFAASQQNSRAIDILVANNADSGNGTLRQAIQYNESLGGGNTIVFSNIVTGTITLTNVLGELLISKDVTITGPGAMVLAISGNNTNRVFHLTNSAVVSISGLTVTAGRNPAGFGGGGIRQDSGNLVLGNCIVSNCISLAPTGANAGGILANGTLTIIGCLIFANASGQDGGGIWTSNVTTVVNSTIANNLSFGSHGGGGIYSGGGTLAVTNCTVVGNSHLGGGTQGGGGINNLAGAASVRNTIIAGNTSGVGGPDCYGAFNSAGYNLIGAINGSSGWGALGDQVGIIGGLLSPLLGPLQDNGGSTFTKAPLTDSPVIDQGNSSGIVTDQRGRPRPYTINYVSSIPLGGDRSDIGACELSEITLEVSNLNDSGSGSLRQAISLASSFEFDTIVFAPALTGTIALTSGELEIGKPLKIQGPAQLPITISGNNASRVFCLTGNILAKISNVTIANAYTNTDGGGILNNSGCVLVLSNCAVIANSCAGNGGGIANNGYFTAYNCTFSSNQAGANGGGIYTYAGPVTLRNCTIVSNTAVSVSGTGGGILNYSLVSGTSNNISGTIVAGNSASSHPDVIGVFTSSGYNLIGKIDYTTQVGGGANNVPTSGLTNNINHDLVGSLASPTNALMGSLQYNGGPTVTHALKSGSPAIDKGISNGLQTDQRGAPRQFDFSATANAAGGDGSDIGAFETGSPQLAIQLAGKSTIVSWPFYYGDFTLQSVTNLAAANWLAVAVVPTLIGDQFNVTNSAASGNQFYRLKAN